MNRFYRADNTILDFNEVVAIKLVGFTAGGYSYKVVFKYGASLEVVADGLIKSYMDYVQQKTEKRDETQPGN